MGFLNFFMTNLLMPISFLVIFFVQLKIIRTLRTHTDLMMFYGKQIEEMRKIVAGLNQTRRPEISTEDTGLYEVLND